MKITIDKQSDTPLYVQIRDAIRSSIDNGDLKPGDKLPPVAALAKQTEVTQATIRRALKDLSSEGHTECHVGRGTFIVDSSGQVESSVTDEDGDQPANITDNQNRPYEFAARRLRQGMSKALDDIMSLAVKPGLIHFTRGIPDSTLLPAGLLDRLTNQTLEADRESLLDAGDPLGRYELRAEIARRASTRNMEITPDQVMITNGSIQAISLLGLANIESRRQILCETPCFKGIIESFAASGHWVETITRDQDGPHFPLPQKERGRPPYLLYLCPYAHNPMGTNLSAEKYRHLVEWCRKTGSLIVADEIFKDLCFDNDPGPSLFETLGPEQCIIVSSLSKSVMTGLRIGWIISSPQDTAAGAAQEGYGSINTAYNPGNCPGSITVRRICRTHRKDENSLPAPLRDNAQSTQQGNAGGPELDNPGRRIFNDA